MININELERMLDEALSKETPESWDEFLKERNMKYLTKYELRKYLLNKKIYLNGRVNEFMELLKNYNIRETSDCHSSNTSELHDNPFVYIDGDDTILNLTFGNSANYFNLYTEKEIKIEDLLDIKIREEFKKGDFITDGRDILIFSSEEDGNINYIAELRESSKVILYSNGSIKSDGSFRLANQEEIKLFKSVFGFKKGDIITYCDNKYLYNIEKVDYAKGLLKLGYVYNVNTKSLRRSYTTINILELPKVFATFIKIANSDAANLFNEFLKLKEILEERVCLPHFKGFNQKF